LNRSEYQTLALSSCSTIDARGRSAQRGVGSPWGRDFARTGRDRGATEPGLCSVARDGGRRYTLEMIEKLDEQSPDPKAPPRTGTLAAAADLASRPTDAFLSSLSHDLRSPLNACVMWLDVLTLSPAPDKLTKAVDAIKRNLARQTRIVNDLSDAAKIASDSLAVRLEPLDLVALLRSHLDAWQLLAIGKQLALHHHIEPTIARIHADPERLLQALNHLLDSALSSTASGGRIDLHVRTERGTCILELSDSGIALSADDAANLGVPLWRAPASAKARAGLGLGLALAHHFVTKHGGTLVARSGGQGAHFTLSLPLLAGSGDR
jgi:signal transduction histidine kinase